MTTWSVVHSSWARNRYTVQQGQTNFERTFVRPYLGKTCMFGECVMAYVRPDKKGVPVCSCLEESRVAYQGTE